MVKNMPLKPQAKTYFMSLIEARHSGQTIESLIVSAYRTHGNERAAAQALGIPQQTFNSWKRRLRLQETISNMVSGRVSKRFKQSEMFS